MALSPDNLPLSCSLREKVIEDHSPQGAPLPEDPLSVDEIVGFLGKSKDTDGTPLATIKRRASKENRRPELRPEDHATLVWVSEAFSDWEENYPLESPLRDHVQRLLPMAVAMALRDDSFFTPGVHPLHKLLDALQFGAVGWQQRLDRAGQMLEQRIDRSIEKALDWFNNDSVDLGAITRELEAANERDAQRAQRMVQRLAETEEARLKTLSARRDAALEINAGLEEFELPSAIGEFLKGPWYDSAQLALVKFGLGSREWDQMQRATRHLMESVQPVDQDDDSDRDRREQILKHLPGQLRRWLLSLEHDSDATDSAIGLVEYAHLRMRHGQKLDLVRIPPLELEEEDLQDEETDDSQFETGQWYQFEDDEGPLRAQLVLQLENDRHLLFANFVGLKALDLPKRAFRQRLDDGFALALPNQGSFSQSLASAAGIDSDERLKKYLDPDYQTEEEREAAAKAEAERAAQEREQAEREAAERETAEREAAEREAAERVAAEREAEARDFAKPERDSELPTQVSDAGFDPNANRADADAEEWSLPGVESTGVESSGTASAEAPSAFGSSLNPALDSSFDPAYDPDLDPVLAPPEGAEFDLDLELDNDAEVAPADTSAPSQGYAADPSGFSQSVPPQQTSYTPPVSPSAPIASTAPPPPEAPPAPEPPPAYAPPSTTPSATPSAPAAAEPPAPPSEPVPPAPEPVAPPQAPQATPQEYAAPTRPSQSQYAAPAIDTSTTPTAQPSTQTAAAPAEQAPAPQATPTPPSAPYTPAGAETAPPAAPGYGTPPAYQTPATQPPPPPAPQAPAERPPAQTFEATPAPPPPQPPSAPPAPEPAAVSTENIETPPADEPAAVREVDVPMGAWLGFHDGETPIMAKLAVFDPKRDNYIFVNRKGIAMRELSRAQLAELIDKGLVDILETRCYFRDEVERARGEEP